VLSDQAAGAGEGAVAAVEAGVVGVVADVNSGVVAAGPDAGWFLQVGVAGESAISSAYGCRVVVADVDGGVVIRASVAGDPASAGLCVDAIGQA
jgi:hypothetical protein